MALYQLNLESEWKRYEKSDIPEDVKVKIKQFIDTLKIQGISEVRQYFYVVRLRKIAELIPDKFLNPGREDVNSVVSTLMSRGKKPNTIEDYKGTLKRFYKWLLGEDEHYPLCVKDLKRKNVENTKRPEDLITEEDMRKLTENSKNSRDRALFNVLYDSGCRIGEIINLKIKDVYFDRYGAVLSVDGKTGFRKVRVFGNSIPYLRIWINDHPKKDDTESPVFCNITDGIRGRSMSYDDIHSVIRKTSKRAGIKKRIHPHLFRHTRASIIAGKPISSSVFESQMGWKPGSKQVRTYVHLNGKQTDESYLKGFGIIKEEENEEFVRPRICPRCGEPNDPNSPKCSKCWTDLTLESLLKTEETDKESMNLIELFLKTMDGASYTQLLKDFLMKDPRFSEKFKNIVQQYRSQNE